VEALVFDAKPEYMTKKGFQAGKQAGAVRSYVEKKISFVVSFKFVYPLRKGW
jgi:hypothetical protein